MIGWEEYKLGNLVEIGRGASPRPIKNYVTDKKYRSDNTH